jgi:hypothetical protein
VVRIGRQRNRATLAPTIFPFALPFDPDGPLYNTWGLYGLDDELGRLNLIPLNGERDEIKEVFPSISSESSPYVPGASTSPSLCPWDCDCDVCTHSVCQ